MVFHIFILAQLTIHHIYIYIYTQWYFEQCYAYDENHIYTEIHGSVAMGGGLLAFRWNDVTAVLTKGIPMRFDMGSQQMMYHPACVTNAYAFSIAPYTNVKTDVCCNTWVMHGYRKRKYLIASVLIQFI